MRRKYESYADDDDKIFVEINVELVLNDWCYIRMMWNVVWQSPFQIVTTFFIQSNGVATFLT